jgi:hypothetical protein
LFTLTPYLVSLARDGGELKDDTLSSEFLIDIAVGVDLVVDLVVDTSTLLGVKKDLDDLVSVLLGAVALSDDFDRVGEVAQD